MLFKYNIYTRRINKNLTYDKTTTKKVLTFCCTVYIA